MCGKGSNTSTSSSAPNPQAMAAYQNLLGQASNVAGLPFQTYGGEFTAPINAQQQQAGSNINQNAGFALPFINQAAGYANQAAQPISASNINQYLSPYTQDVVNATQAQFNQNNQIQQNQLTGNAAAQGALGGDRVGVAQALLAGQQQKSEAPVIAGLYNSGYGQALQTALAEQQNLGQSAYSLGNLGVAGQNAALSGANAQLGYGTLQQSSQQALDQALYNQFLAKQAYPFQTTQWQAGIDTGVGSQMGGTSSTTGPAPNQGAQWAGLGLAALSFLNRGGGVHRDAGGRIHGFDMGGTPYAGGASYVPTIGITGGHGAPNAPGSGGQGQNQIDPFKLASSTMDLQKKIKGLGGSGGLLGIPSFGDPGLDEVTQAGAEAGLSPEELGLGGGGEESLGMFGLGGWRRGGRIAGFAGGGYADGGSPDMPVTLPTFGDRISGFGSPDAGIIEDRRGDPESGYQHMQKTNDMVGAVARHLIPGLKNFDMRMPTPRHHSRESGQLPIDIGRYDIGGHASGGRIGYADGGGDDSFEDRFSPAYGQDERLERSLGLGDVTGRYPVPGQDVPLPRSRPSSDLSGSSAAGGDYVNPTRVNGQPQNLTGDIIPPGGFGGGPTEPLPPAQDVADRRVAGLGQSPMSFAPDTGATRGYAPVPGTSGAPSIPTSEGKQSGFGLGFNPLGLSDNARQGMLAAGLGMLASRSPFLGNAIGEGGLAGLQAYSGAKKEEFNEKKAVDSLHQQAKLAEDRIKRETQRDADTAEYRKAVLNKPPAGYERVENGLRALPGGPADPEVAGKVAGAKKGTTGDLLDDVTLKRTAAQFNLIGGQALTNLGRGAQSGAILKQVRTEAARQDEEAGITPEQRVQIQAETLGQRAAQRTLSTQEAKMGSAAFEAEGAMKLARPIIDKIDASRTGFLPFNQLIVGFNNQTLNPDQKELAGRLQAIVNTYAAVMSRGANVVTDTARAHGAELLNSAFNGESLNRMLDTMQSEIDMAKGSPERMREFYMQRYGKGAVEGQGTAAAPNAPAGGGAGPAGGGAHPQAQQALEWANAHPDDPRAAAIKQRLGVQ